MCGRFSLFTSDDELCAIFGIDVLEGEHYPSYNQAPGQLVRVVVGGKPRFLTLFQWGLVPAWAKPGTRPLINARSETLTEKPSFRAAALRRRCLVPVDGYFEWAAEAAGKQPYFLSGSGVMALAGVFEVFHGAGGEEIYSCAILTREAAESVSHIHPRMPMVVPADRWTEWLDPNTQDRAAVEMLVQSLPPAALSARPVLPAVGSVATQDPELIFGTAEK